MVGGILSFFVQYAAYALEVGVVAVMVWRGQWKRHVGLFVYVALLVVIDALARPLFLYRYGLTSPQYFYVYWLTNTLLQLAAFLLICFFFRVACRAQKKLWETLKLALPATFLLVVGFTFLSIWRNYSQMRTREFLTSFEQYLYFTCLVLNTILFVMIQYVELDDEVMPMVICGLGLQFAGPAAGMALMVLAGASVQGVAFLIDQLCSLGMLLTWLYAVNRVPGTRAVVYKPEGVVAERAAA